MDLIYFWDVPYCVFKTITPLIKYPTYSYYICRGIALSAGGITESTMNESVCSLTKVFEDLELTKDKGLFTKGMILDNYIKALEKHRRVEKFITPLFNTLSYMFTNQGVFSYSELLPNLEK